MCFYIQDNKTVKHGSSLQGEGYKFTLKYMDRTRRAVGGEYIIFRLKISIKLVAFSYLHVALSDFCATW